MLIDTNVLISIFESRVLKFSPTLDLARIKKRLRPSRVEKVRGSGDDLLKIAVEIEKEYQGYRDIIFLFLDKIINILVAECNPCYIADISKIEFVRVVVSKMSLYEKGISAVENESVIQSVYGNLSRILDILRNSSIEINIVDITWKDVEVAKEMLTILRKKGEKNLRRVAVDTLLLAKAETLDTRILTLDKDFLKIEDKLYDVDATLHENFSFIIRGRRVWFVWWPGLLI